VFRLGVFKPKYGKIAQPCPKTGRNQEAEGWKALGENQGSDRCQPVAQTPKILILKLEKKSSCPKTYIQVQVRIGR